MPSARLRAMTLVAQATSFAEQAKIYESTLAEHGLPADAVAQLDVAIAAYRSSIVGRGSARTNLATATTSVQEHIVLGRSIVTGMNGVVQRTFDGRKDTLAGWHSAKRVSPVAARSSGLSAVASAPVPVPPASAAGQSVPVGGQSVPVGGQSTSVVGQPPVQSGQSAAPAIPSELPPAQRAA